MKAIVVCQCNNDEIDGVAIMKIIMCNNNDNQKREGAVGGQ